MNFRAGLARLQIVYLAIATLVIAWLTIQAGGDEHRSGWDRITNPTIVYWASERPGLPPLNTFWLPASLTDQEARDRLLAEGKLQPNEDIIPFLIYTWNDYAAWPIMWTGTSVALGILAGAYISLWVAKGFAKRS